MLWLDAYERRARLAPGLLALLPIAFAVVALGLRKVPAASVAIGVLSAAGGPVLLAGLVRRFGLAAQATLWADWTGPPTAMLLRLREVAPNPQQRDIWRRAVAAVTGITLFPKDREAQDFVAADQAIEVATNRLREMTRNATHFPLVQAENKEYGFQRNLYGFRCGGRIVAAVCVLVILGCLIWQLSSHSDAFQVTSLAVGLIIDALLFVVWLWVPSSAQVRQAGDKYAHQLLHAAITLESALPAS